MVPLYVALRRQRQIVPSKMILVQCTTFDNSRRNSWCFSAYLSLKAKASSFFVICIRTCIVPPASSQIFPLAVYIEQAHDIITSMFTRAWDLPMCVTHSPMNISRCNRRGWVCYQKTNSTNSLNLRRNGWIVIEKNSWWIKHVLHVFSKICHYHKRSVSSNITLSSPFVL